MASFPDLSSRFHSSLIRLCHSQSSSPQNIETFYPTETPTLPPGPSGTNRAPPSTASNGSSSSNSKIAKAVAATAGATFVVSALIFFIVHRCLRTRRKHEAVVPQNQINGFERIGENVRGLIVDENGLDVVYWRKLRGRSSNGDFHKEVFRSAQNKQHQEKDDEENQKPETVQEFPLLRGKSSTSHIPEDDESNRIITARTSLPPTPAIPKRNSSAPPTSPSPLQPIQARKNSPPARPRSRQPPTVKSSSKPPPTSHETPTNNGRPGNSSGEGTSESGNGQMKLKPLHWDRMNSNSDHSKVRDKANAGSFSVDQDLMEALFGYVAINRRSPKGRTSDSAIQSRGVSSQGQVRLGREQQRT
ncbi:formin-like protein 4 [Prosopis cineraria]|uniref:formin-like protein 4 n=1 Tax=Prosopis cineraria TaxID=364024 RepID=UPI00241037F7|nr:formin-like protein 4 [Prosopis cineraria]